MPILTNAAPASLEYLPSDNAFVFQLFGFFVDPRVIIHVLDRAHKQCHPLWIIRYHPVGQPCVPICPSRQETPPFKEDRAELNVMIDASDKMLRQSGVGRELGVPWKDS